MTIFKSITIHLRLSFFTRFIRPYHYVHDKYFDYFRNNKHYKNCVIQLNADAKINKSISFDKKDYQVEEIFPYLMQRENVMKLSSLQLKDILYLMANTEIDSEKFEDAIKFIDEKCALSVNRWPLDLSLYVLDAWFIILGPKVFRKHYYCAFSNLLNKKMKKCSKYDLILSLYFIGMSKKSPPFLMEFMKYKMEYFVSDLTDEEWAIACLSFFKTSTKMDSELLLKQCSKAAENLMLKNDRFNLISVLKCLRLSEYFDANLMKKLGDFIKKEHKSFNFVECTNFLASFATLNVYDCEIYNCLEIQGVSELSKENAIPEYSIDIKKIHPAERSRVKDLARFLWGMSFVGHTMDKWSLDKLIDFLSARLEIGEFESNLPVLVDCVQSLILLGQYPQNIIEYVLNPLSMQKISNIEKAKPKYQLYFISRSAYLENCITEIKNRKSINNIPKSLEKEISQRQGFLEIIDYLNANLKEKSFICCYILPHIMISGIFIATDHKENSSNNSVTSTLLKLIEDGIVSKSVQSILNESKIYTCVELLDPSVCIHGGNMPIGLMKTKIRQLQKLNINVITLSLEEVNFTKLGLQNCTKLQNLFM